jgi:GntR family transcriptional regulator/MocR family aminotransferase
LSGFSIPPIDLDRSSTTTLRRQIYQQTARAIRSGAFRGDARLPSSRWLAKLLGVSRNTVLAAYDELAAEGLLIGVRGAGMRVARGVLSPAPLAGLRHVIREAGYPASLVEFEDPDGNLLYINF